MYEIRTRDTWVHSPPRYPLRYGGQCNFRCSDVDQTLYTLGYHKLHCCQNCCYINSYFLYAGITRFRLYCFTSYYDALRSVFNVNYVFVVEYCRYSSITYVFTETNYLYQLVIKVFNEEKYCSDKNYQFFACLSHTRLYYVRFQRDL